MDDETLEFELTPADWQDALDELEAGHRFWIYTDEKDPFKKGLGANNILVDLNIVKILKTQRKPSDIPEIFDTKQIKVVRTVMIPTKHLSDKNQMIGFDERGKPVFIKTTLAIAFECVLATEADEALILGKDLTFNEMVELELPIVDIWFNSLSPREMKVMLGGDNPIHQWNSISMRDKNYMMESNAGKEVKVGGEMIKIRPSPPEPDPSEVKKTVPPPPVDQPTAEPEDISFTPQDADAFFEHTRSDLQMQITGATPIQNPKDIWDKKPLPERREIMKEFKFRTIQQYMQRFTDCHLSDPPFWPCDHAEKNVCPEGCPHFTDHFDAIASEEQNLAKEIAEEVMEEKPVETELTPEEKKVLGPTHFIDPYKRDHTMCGLEIDMNLISITGDSRESTCEDCDSGLQSLQEKKAKDRPVSKMNRQQLMDYAKEHAIPLLKADLKTNTTIREKIFSVTKPKKKVKKKVEIPELASSPPAQMPPPKKQTKKKSLLDDQDKLEPKPKKKGKKKSGKKSKK